MQQTDKYKLNKPEMDDQMSLTPLNENMDKVEGELDALDGRVTMLEAKHFVFGTYTGDGQHSQFIELGFTPIAVVALHISTTNPCSMAVQGQPTGVGAALEITENGFDAKNTSGNSLRDMNNRNLPVNYIAFG